MQIRRIHIQNYKSIRELTVTDAENALILVGRNNTGKTVVMDAVRTALGGPAPAPSDFNRERANIRIELTLALTEEDLKMLHARGRVSKYKHESSWMRDFHAKLPFFSEGLLPFAFVANSGGTVRYEDPDGRVNRWIRDVLPRLYCIDTGRDLTHFQEDLLLSQEDENLSALRTGVCMFDPAKACNHCFSCIGLIEQKSPAQLNTLETARLLEYKMCRLNLEGFAERVNDNFKKNGGLETISYSMHCDPDALFKVRAEARREDRQRISPVEELGNGMKSIYMLSLLETYVEDEKSLPSILLVEYPELFLHPSMQKTAAQLLFRLSLKNQVIFTTHSPNILSNFTNGQLRQIVLDEEGYSVVRPHANLDEILDDLGFSANDFLNVSFVFIVEGKQDKSRLPLLLENYYPEIHDAKGNLSRISIITTNSCTNIKTYANLKFMNRVYLRDQFLMIRDGDGKNPESLTRQLCGFYEAQNRTDADRLPRVGRENVLILKYYSFENYFLNPRVMAKLHIVHSEEEFWQILLRKWKETLSRTTSGRALTRAIGREIRSIRDLKEHFEEFKIHVRGHNLYDIFYGRFKKHETELLRRYIRIAPREDFADILDAIDRFPYFDSRKSLLEMENEKK